MTLITDPAVEACRAIAARVETGTYVCTPSLVNYSEIEIDPLEEVTSALRVDVVAGDQEQLNETLGNDRTSHVVRVFIRARPQSIDQRYIDELNTTVAQISERLWRNDNGVDCGFDSADGRVRVWECNLDPQQRPDKQALKDRGEFIAAVVLRVEVETS